MKKIALLLTLIVVFSRVGAALPSFEGIKPYAQEAIARLPFAYGAWILGKQAKKYWDDRYDKNMFDNTKYDYNYTNYLKASINSGLAGIFAYQAIKTEGNWFKDLAKIQHGPNIKISDIKKLAWDRWPNLLVLVISHLELLAGDIFADPVNASSNLYSAKNVYRSITNDPLKALSTAVLIYTLFAPLSTPTTWIKRINAGYLVGNDIYRITKSLQNKKEISWTGQLPRILSEVAYGLK